MAVLGPETWVALALPFSDGSGDVFILGVYSSQEGAQAACWRFLRNQGFDQPTDVVRRLLDMDTEQMLDAADNGRPTDG